MKKSHGPHWASSCEVFFPSSCSLGDPCRKPCSVPMYRHPNTSAIFPHRPLEVISEKVPSLQTYSRGNSHQISGIMTIIFKCYPSHQYVSKSDQTELKLFSFLGCVQMWDFDSSSQRPGTVFIKVGGYSDSSFWFGSSLFSYKKVF